MSLQFIFNALARCRVPSSPIPSMKCSVLGERCVLVFESVCQIKDGFSLQNNRIFRSAREKTDTQRLGTQQNGCRACVRVCVCFAMTRKKKILHRHRCPSSSSPQFNEICKFLGERETGQFGGGARTNSATLLSSSGDGGGCVVESGGAGGEAMAGGLLWCVCECGRRAVGMEKKGRGKIENFGKVQIKH